MATASADEMKETLDHIIGTIYGNCAGDAIGLLTEFMIKDEAKKYYGKHKKLEYDQKVPDMHRSRWKNGDWTDDSDQMILIMQMLCKNDGKIDPVDFGRRLKYWARNGFPELGDTGGMGIGATTFHVLHNEKYDAAPCEAAEFVWEKSGRFVAPNGAVMRTSVLGIHDYKNIEHVIHNAKEICKTSHYDPRCQASCVAVTTAIALMLQRQEKHMKKGKFDIDAIIDESYQHARACLTDKEQIKELHDHMYAKKLGDLKLDEDKKIGYTFKCMGSAFWAVRQKDFREALQAVVMQAGDADTNGAVAGALLGCKLGVKKIPESWTEKFHHKKWLDKQIVQYLEVLDKVMGHGDENNYATIFRKTMKIESSEPSAELK